VPQSPKVLEVCGLGKRFGPRWIFRGIDFKVDAGKSLVVIGRNGSGKSTLLRCLAGLDHPTEGHVRVEGDPRTTIGYASLEMALYPALTVREHLALTAEARGCEARSDELLELVGLAPAGNLAASQLSTGMKSRLKIALALQPRPSLLLLDEPGAGLDEQGRILLTMVVAEQTARGALVIATNDSGERRFATHELELAT
jgi:ABC-type multidrug transport system ATPase subunit